MKSDEVEFLWSFCLTPSFSFLQPSCNVGPSCAPKRPLTPGAWSQHMPWGTSQVLGPLQFFVPWASSGLSHLFSGLQPLRRKRWCIVSGANCVTIPNLSHLCQLGKQDPKLKTCQMLLVTDAIKTRPCSPVPGRSLHTAPHLGYFKIKCFQPQTASWCASPMLLSA